MAQGSQSGFLSLYLSVFGVRVEPKQQLSSIATITTTPLTEREREEGDGELACQPARSTLL